jgi:hypothetical protein
MKSVRSPASSMAVAAMSTLRASPDYEAEVQARHAGCPGRTAARRLGQNFRGPTKCAAVSHC